MSVGFINQITYLLGYCAEFNEYGARIQEHYNKKCSDVTPTCPIRYKSTDAYRCMFMKLNSKKSIIVALMRNIEIPLKL